MNKSKFSMTTVVIGTYMLSSSMMLVTNKLTVEYFRSPILLLIFQLSFASVFLSLMSHLNYIKLTEPSLDVLKQFWLVPIAFLMTLFCNIQILAHSNVETFIVLRASTPIVLSVLDVQFLGRKLPNRRSWVSIFGVFFFSCIYVYYEKAQLTSDSVFWLVSWYCIFCFDQIYIKHVVDTVKMTMWDRVWYTNTIPVFILAPVALFHEEPVVVNDPYIFVFIAITCVIGVSMSFYSFTLRRVVSATAFTIIGNTCKLITIIVNYFIWEKHASLEAIGALLMCIGFSSYYQQADMDKEGKDQKRLRLFYYGFAFLAFVTVVCVYEPIETPFKVFRL